MPCYWAPADRQNKILTLCTGLNSTPGFYKNFVEQHNKMGASVLMQSLPSPDDLPPVPEGEDRFVPLYHKIAESFYGDVLPDFMDEHPYTPKILYTHSTAGQLFLNRHKDPEKAHQIASCIDSAVHLAPFISAANISKIGLLNQARRFFYMRGRANHPVHKEMRYMDEGLGFDRLHRLWCRVAREPLTTSSDKNPLHVHIAELMRHGESLYDELLENGLPKTGLPQLIVAGDIDTVSCNKVLRKLVTSGISEKMNLLMIDDVSHNPLLEQGKRFSLPIYQATSLLADGYAYDKALSRVNEPGNMTVYQPSDPFLQKHLLSSWGEKTGKRFIQTARSLIAPALKEPS